ncbi:hypothetical protein QTO34_001764 [Cnephaeus nilssonii]|uniref:Ubiquitin-like domain-containing protein n=1 Tax=Cnephaeus nilssonii TaxID=3371016 RepID=A0AA40LM46_CNENI|nr:hypothetical protein QTO34_001764 [Eptesicus nilssonii]
MRRAAEGAAGAGGERTAKLQGGALRPDPAAGQRGGRRLGPVGRRHLPSKPRVRGRTHSLSHNGDSQAMNMALDLAPDVFVMRETGEMFTVTDCHGDMTVQELKEELDLAAGIPLNLQLLQYLDQGILMDDTTLRFHDVVPGGIISLHVWRYDGWADLVLAAVEGDTSKLSCLGVSEDSPYRTASLHYLGEKQRKKWVAQRAFVALYVASHRGHVEAVQYLLEQGANCLGRSPMGRTPLHVAAVTGQSDCIGLLLQHGASIYAKDAKGVTPKDIAHQLNHRQDEQQMFLFSQQTKPGAKGLKT